MFSKRHDEVFLVVDVSKCTAHINGLSKCQSRKATMYRTTVSTNLT
jgi:hypothetical protein